MARRSVGEPTTRESLWEDWIGKLRDGASVKTERGSGMGVVRKKRGARAQRQRQRGLGNVVDDEDEDERNVGSHSNQISSCDLNDVAQKI